jgi:D-mannonate dehydratase
VLRHACQFFADRGLRLGVIENVPLDHLDKVMLGLPGRDEQINHYATTIRNMGRAGIPVLGYQWMALGGISIDFCQGTISEMPGVDVLEAIHHFGSQGKILFAHFRDTRGTIPRFTEVFMDEGDTDMFAAMLAYREVGYEGLIRADHTPAVVGDNQYAHRGFAFQVGYMRGLIQAVQGQAVEIRRAGG